MFPTATLLTWLFQQWKCSISRNNAFFHSWTANFRSWHFPSGTTLYYCIHSRPKYFCRGRRGGRLERVRRIGGPRVGAARNRRSLQFFWKIQCKINFCHFSRVFENFIKYFGKIWGKISINLGICICICISNLLNFNQKINGNLQFP